MPLLDVRRLAPGFTEYRITPDGSKYRFVACSALLALSLAGLAWRFQRWAQIASWVAALMSAYRWAFTTRHESVTVIKGLALQLQCTVCCGLSSTNCYAIDQVQDALIWEHVSTTEVRYYLAFKIAGQEDLIIAYRSMLPHLHLIQPVYKQLLRELQGLHGHSSAA
ncbi:hypothetical protein ABBQ32_012682 [Trebouxia sp. C0010 RCD-2024]